MRQLLLLTLPLWASCASARWERNIAERPIEAAQVSALALGVDDVASCLAKLGAPTHVWPRATGEVILAYGWLRADHWGFRVSIATRGNTSPFVDFDSLGAETKGYALDFDAGWILRSVHFGYLEDLAEALVQPKSAARFGEGEL